MSLRPLAPPSPSIPCGNPTLPFTISPKHPLHPTHTPHSTQNSPSSPSTISEGHIFVGNGLGGRGNGMIERF